MLSPDQGNLGVRAAFVFAALIVPLGVLTYFFYPEVRYGPLVCLHPR